ncbi:MAG TPA: hypothetical protein VD791_12245 [Burkholderiales bacterium]|nr:hypothetical protein [Burkholderiales bacterium]
MRNLVAIVGQALLYAAFAACVGLFSMWPPYRHLEPGQALLKLSFSHAGERVAECRRRTPQELAKLPPNMRAPLDCPRERSPVSVELKLDGQVIARRVVSPSGLARDGAATMYERFPVPAGAHRLEVEVDDSVRAPGPTWEREQDVRLAPGRVLVVDLDPEKGGIVIQ